PLFNAGRTQAMNDIAASGQTEALLRYEDTMVRALEDVENALVSLANSREREGALISATEAARNAALLARDRYASGLTDFQTLLIAERTVRLLEDSLATTQADSASALIQLYKALGGGWPSGAASQ
ncbi:MAG: TolC family protein, partial [Burkholderiales bacterium]